jgi:hypothetical protein
MMRALFALGFVSCLAMSGCAPPAGEVSLEIGTGSEGFEPVEDGGVMLLARGCQGAQHVWVSLRARGIAPERALLDISLRRLSDDAPLSTPFRIFRTFEPAGEGDMSEVTGLAVVVGEPDDVLDEAVVLEVAIYDRSGFEVRSAREVIVEWGTEVCGSGATH